MMQRPSRLALMALLVASSAYAATLPVGSSAEMFTLKVVNAETAAKKIYALGQQVGEGAQEPKKVVILSFFATYCEPCKKELPFLQELHKRYADQGLGIVVVSIDKDADNPGGAVPAIEKLIGEHKLTFPVLHDRFNIVAKRYGVERLPCLYMVDSGGKVAFNNVGYTGDFSATLATEVQTRLGVKLEKIEHVAAQADKGGKGHGDQKGAKGSGG